MAFDVTPTAGDGPYVYTAEFNDKSGFLLGLYVTEFRSITTPGSCPTDVSGSTNNPTASLSLQNTGSYTSSNNVASGSCRHTSYLVRRVSDNEIVSQVSVDIDNV